MRRTVHGVFKADADSDIIVPDTKPDVLKIIGAAATLVIKKNMPRKARLHCRALCITA